MFVDFDQQLVLNYYHTEQFCMYEFPRFEKNALNNIKNVGFT